MTKRKNVMDITPVCERCGKVAQNWTVYRTKEPCECGGKYTARAFLDDSVLSSCDKETNHADEYISREAALTALQDSDLFNTTERQLRAIRELPAADVAPVQKWISVKDRSPEAGGYVVCIAKRNPFSRFMPMVAKIERNGWVNPITEQYISDVSHWMPIPEPPKEE